MCQLSVRVIALYIALVGHFYKFRRGDRVMIISGQYASQRGTVDSAVFQRTGDWPEEFAPGYHVLLDDGAVATVRWDQVRAIG